MAVSTTYNPYFTGRVIQKEYSQVYDLEYLPNYSTVTKDGVEVSRYIASYTRNLVTTKVVEQTFRFLGLTRALAFATTSGVTVADLNNNEYTFDLKCSVTDGSSGSRVMPIEEVTVDRTPITPRMWELTVTRRGMRYFVNGTQIIAGPSWISSYV